MLKILGVILYDADSKVKYDVHFKPQAGQSNFGSTGIEMEVIDVSKKGTDKSGDVKNSVIVHFNSYAEEIENNQPGAPQSAIN